MSEGKYQETVVVEYLLSWRIRLANGELSYRPSIQSFASQEDAREFAASHLPKITKGSAASFSLHRRTVTTTPLMINEDGSSW